MPDPSVVPELGPAESRRFLDLVLGTVPTIIYVYDLVERRNVFANREVSELLGYTPEQVREFGDQLFVETIHPDDLPAVMAHHAALRVASPGAILELEYRMKSAAGTWCWLRSRDTAFEQDDDGLVRTILGSAEDVTERKASEGGLALFRRFAEAATEGFGMATLDGRIHYVNPALVRMLGAASPADITGVPFARFYDEPHQRRLAQEVIPSVMAEGSWQGELELQTLDGRTITTHEHYFLVRDDEGNPAYLADVISDISQRKRVEDELRRFQRFAEAATEAFAMADLEGNVLYANAALARILDAEGGHELVGRSLAEFHTAAAQQRIDAEVLPQVLATGSWQGELEFEGVEGRVVSTRDHIFLVHDDAGRPLCLAAVSSDITDERRAQEELRRHREELEQLVAERTAELQREKDFVEAIQASLPGIFYVLDTQGDFVRWNARFEELAGRTAEQMASANALDLFGGDDKEHIAERIGRVFVDGEATAEADLLPLDGPGIPHIFTGRLAQLDGAPHLVGMGLDITERRAVEREREQLNTDLERKNEELEQVVYVTSHDLRSPLVNVQGFSRELGRGVRELLSILEEADLPEQRRQFARTIIQEDVDESLEFIASSVSKMEGLLAGLLQLSRAGRREPKPEPILPQTLLQEVLRSFEFVIQERGIEVDVEPIPACIGDREQLAQAFANLVDNAIKYLDPKRPGRLRFSGRRRHERIEICIEDNGVGIDPRHQGRIFDIFHRLDPRGTQGEGIGLTIVRKILFKNDGTIRLESAPGEGTRFYVELPAAEVGR